ncbi:MAG: FIG028593: membrane protein, partial [uncultured Nocardioidaceae bacterium]
GRVADAHLRRPTDRSAPARRRGRGRHRRGQAPLDRILADGAGGRRRCCGLRRLPGQSGGAGVAALSGVLRFRRPRRLAGPQRAHGPVRDHEHAGLQGPRGGRAPARHHADLPHSRHHRREAAARADVRLRPLCLRVGGAGAGLARHPLRRCTGCPRPHHPARHPAVGTAPLRRPRRL